MFLSGYKRFRTRSRQKFQTLPLPRGLKFFFSSLISFHFFQSGQAYRIEDALFIRIQQLRGRVLIPLTVQIVCDSQKEVLYLSENLPTASMHNFSASQILCMSASDPSSDTLTRLMTFLISLQMYCFRFFQDILRILKSVAPLFSNSLLSFSWYPSIASICPAH